MVSSGVESPLQGTVGMRSPEEVDRIRKQLQQLLEEAASLPDMDSRAQDDVAYLNNVIETMDWMLGDCSTEELLGQCLMQLKSAGIGLSQASAPSFSRDQWHPYSAKEPADFLWAASEPAASEEVRPPGLFGRLFDRLNAVDWRYKAQATLLFALAITIPFYLLRDEILALGDWGYLGAFLVNGLSSASIILPAPGGVLIAIMGQDFNPFLIGIAAGIGGSLGGATAYVLGAATTQKVQKGRWFPWIARRFHRFGAIIVFLFAMTPFLPGDFASLIAGAVRYPLLKYFLYNGIGSIIKMTAIAYMGAELLDMGERIVDRIIGSWF